jgi:hypothetical protein
MRISYGLSRAKTIAPPSRRAKALIEEELGDGIADEATSR